MAEPRAIAPELALLEVHGAGWRGSCRRVAHGQIARAPAVLVSFECPVPRSSCSAAARARPGGSVPLVSCSLVPLPLRCSCSFGCSYPFGVLFLRCSYPSGAPTPPVLLPLRCSYPFGALFLGAPTPSVLAPLRRSDPCDAPTPPTPLPLRCSYPFAPRTPLLLVPWRNLAMPKARSERRNRVHVWGGDGGG